MTLVCPQVTLQNVAIDSNEFCLALVNNTLWFAIGLLAVEWEKMAHDLIFLTDPTGFLCFH